VVEPPGHGDQLGRDGAIEIWATKARRALEAAVLVEDDAFAHERGPGQKVSETGGGATIFGEVHHGPVSHAQMAGDAEVPAHHVDEHRIAFGRPHRSEMADGPEADP